MILCIDWVQMGVSSASCDVGCICRHMRYQLCWNIQGSSLTCQAPWQGWPEGFTWNMQRSKSQLLCFSSLLLDGNSGLPKVQKGKLLHLFKAWAQHCHFCHILLVKHLILHLSFMTMSSVPHIDLCQNVNFFFTSEPSNDMELFFMFYI